MVKSMLIGLIIIGSALTVPAAPVFAIDQGVKAPEFSLPLLGGGTVSLAAQSGKVVYLDFWASWCGPCKETLPWMEQLKRRFGARGLEVIAVNVDSELDLANEALSGVDHTYTIALDPEMSVVSKYEPRAMPTSYIIDRSGTIAMIHSGFRDGDQRAIEERISELLGN